MSLAGTDADTLSNQGCAENRRHQEQPSSGCPTSDVIERQPEQQGGHRNHLLQQLSRVPAEESAAEQQPAGTHLALPNCS